MSLDTDLTNNFEFSATQFNFLLTAGGPVLVILLITSIIAVTIIIAKSLQLLSIEKKYADTCDQIANRWITNKEVCSSKEANYLHNPVVRVVTATVKGLSTPNLNHESIHSEITRLAKSELQKLRSFLKSLEVIATITPLLGLLGTVLGMIKAFQKLQEAGTQVDPSILSGGIWEALLTTAAGLTVAIPAFIAYTWLDKKVDNIRFAMEDYVTRILSSDAYKAMNTLQITQEKQNIIDQPVTVAR